MKKTLKATLAVALVLGGMCITAAKADTVPTTTVTADGVTGTDPVPTTPDVPDIILIVLQSLM
jgi:PBP1b-binding outer membrane lipoprotein LpoB